MMVELDEISAKIENDKLKTYLRKMENRLRITK